MDRDPIVRINGDDLALIEELEPKIAPDGGETVLPLPGPRGFRGCDLTSFVLPSQ